MNTFYNAVLALQNAHTGDCVYHLPLGSPRHKAFQKRMIFVAAMGQALKLSLCLILDLLSQRFQFMGESLCTFCRTMEGKECND